MLLCRPVDAMAQTVLESEMVRPTPVVPICAFLSQLLINALSHHVYTFVYIYIFTIPLAVF